MGQVRFKKGTYNLLPAEDTEDSILFTTDTHELFMGMGTGNELIKISDIETYATANDFPAEGHVGKIYVDLSTLKLYTNNGAVFQLAWDSHNHENFAVLALISAMVVGGDTTLGYDSNALQLLSSFTSAMALKADLVDGKIPVSQLPPGVKDTLVVADITARDALSVALDTFVWVVDASDDFSVTSGAALYVYTSGGWQKVSEAESLDVDLSILMRINDYDSNADGIVDLTDSIFGVDSAANSTYYGTDDLGEVGFHAFDPFEWLEHYIVAEIAWGDIASFENPTIIDDTISGTSSVEEIWANLETYI